ncbi:MAG: prepilin-type N-terminal cleavage/methylation domain-containing protein [Candidatus Paceibacterota bacterium]
MKKNIFKKNNKESGFTIIETMIAIAVFLIVVMIGMGALLNASLIHNKSQNMRSIMDNLSFIMEDMSRNLRIGYDYHCIDNGVPTETGPHNCVGTGRGISFKTPQGEQWVYMMLVDDNGFGYIEKSTAGGILDSFVRLTPEEINLDGTSQFFVTGAKVGAEDNLQPFVTIKLVGKITYKGTDTPFSLQTSVSQRQLDRTQ